MAIWNERIKEKRLERGFTLSQVSEKLKVTEATAQRYESGSIKSVPYEHICTYADILGCSPSYLMGWDSQESKSLSLTDDESLIINSYRSADDVDKQAVHRILGLDTRNNGFYDRLFPEV